MVQCLLLSCACTPPTQIHIESGMQALNFYPHQHIETVIVHPSVQVYGRDIAENFVVLKSDYWELICSIVNTQ